MAKNNQPEPVDSGDLAERLFVAAWRIDQTHRTEEIARQCIEAAEAFERAKRNKTAIPFAGAAKAS